MLARTGAGDHSSIAGGSANLYNHSGNQFVVFSEIVLPEDPAILFLGIHPKDVPPHHQDTCSTMFIADFFLIARNWNPDVPKPKNGYRECGSFTQ